MAINIDTIIFDLGGVLVELGEFPIKNDWWPKDTNSALAHGATVSAAWLQSDLVQAFETGKLRATEFAEQFIAEHRLSVDTDTFITELRAWPTRTFPGATELLTSLRTHYRIGLFSNINELHWCRVMDEMGLAGHFDHEYASHLIGRAKPAITSFEHIISDLNRQPEQILFLDDNIINVDAAAQTGICARQVMGVTGVTATLAELGLIPEARL